MRTLGSLGLAFLLLSCSDDTKSPVDSTVTKAEAKVTDGPGIRTEGGIDKGGSTGDKGGVTDKGAKDGASAGIGPSGGQAKSPDGFFTLDVPAGALSTTVSFVITKAAANPPYATVSSWSKLSTSGYGTKTLSAKTTHTSCNCAVEGVGGGTVYSCYQVKPHNINFSTQATFLFDHNNQIWDLVAAVYTLDGDCPPAM
jgi:hypothetical protein